MKDKATIRYLGYQTLADGGRGFDFSCALNGGQASTITIEAPRKLFVGPDRIAIQEGAGICYETLRARLNTDSEIPDQRFSLNPTDVAQHRKTSKTGEKWHS
jgi:hypothetical protein